MRKMWQRTCLIALAFASALFCWFHALSISADILATTYTVSMRYKTGGVSGMSAARMLEEEAAPFAVWNQRDGVLVEEVEFSRGNEISLLEVVGDAELVIAAEKLTSGFMPVRGSMNTCAIDSDTSYVLWGSMGGIGEIILCGEKEYTVTGIFGEPQNTMLIQSENAEDSVFPYAELSVSNIESSSRQADEFHARYLLPEPDAQKNNAESAAILRQTALFPALLCATLLLWRILRRICGNSRLIFATAMLAGVFITAWAIGFSPVIPHSFIPGRWSDLSFWYQLIENIAEQTKLSQTFAWPTPDLMRNQERTSLLYYSAGAVAGFLASILYYSKVNWAKER
jgi:hypothetical protein